ncbi:hypothetical protein HZH66_006966 [Vespula vulgaris]|uniref:Uncharacterized protein n=1 Tax=Vespula vulgaris TaxID=7454 RepID=A0A834K2A3_VESVU|nr:hypothetical protein HZH66_006966 [Vespula vulgaris]
METFVEMEKSSEKLLSVVADIFYDCILRREVLSQIGMNKQFRKIILGNSGSVVKILEEILREFAEKSIVGNCGIVEYVIELTDFCPIKQFL